MRQTPHDKRVYEIDIVDGKGMKIIKPSVYTASELKIPISIIRKILEAEYKKESEL